MSIADMFIAEQDTDTMRICGTCGERKPVEEFYKDGKDSKGNPKYRRDCKDCYKLTRMKSKMEVKKNDKRKR